MELRSTRNVHAATKGAFSKHRSRSNRRQNGTPSNDRFQGIRNPWNNNQEAAQPPTERGSFGSAYNGDSNNPLEGSMSNDPPVIQIVAIHLRAIGGSVLVPIKGTQVRVSGWRPMALHGTYIPASCGSVPRFLDCPLLTPGISKNMRDLFIMR